MKFFKEDELKLLWPFYLNALVSPILYFAPAFFIPYFLDLNFSMTQIGFLFAIQAATTIIFEIPTGAFADVYGRKLSSILGFFLEGIAVFGLWVAHSFESAAILFALIGFSATLYSGAYQSWAVDLINKKNKNLVKQFFIKDRALVSIALLLSGIIGAFFVKQFGLSIIWPIGALTYLVTVIILLFGKEEFTPKKRNISQIIKNTTRQTKNSFKFVSKNRTLVIFLIITFLTGLLSSFTGQLSWSAFFKEINLPDYAFGYLWSFISFIGIISPFLGNFIKKRKEKTALMILSIISFFSIITIFWIYSIAPALAVFAIVLFTYMAAYPISNTFMHRLISKEHRATVSSLSSMIISIGGVASAVIAGRIIDSFGARMSLLTGAFITIPIVIFYLLIKKEN